VGTTTGVLQEGTAAAAGFNAYELRKMGLVEERLTGRRWRQRILARYGSTAGVEAAAKIRDHVEARHDLATLRLLEERPGRLDETFRTELILQLDTEDLAQLTAERIRLLAAIAETDTPLNLSRLTQLVGRDKKNVSQDLHRLASLGLLHLERVGRELRPRIHANEIRIVLDAPAA
jgi:hypothetical protein